MGKTYISPSGLAKEVQKIYYGDENNLAQEISKVYVGDSNGVARLVFGNSAILPREYQQVLYIESTGTQYINTGIAHTLTSAVRAKIAFTAKISGQNSYNGNIYSGSQNYSEYSFFGYDKTEDKLIIQHYETGIYKVTKTMISFDTNIHEYLYDNKNKIIQIDNTSKSINTREASIDSRQTQFIFATRTSISGNVNYYCKEKLYSWKHYENNVVIRNFYPCYRKSDGVIGLYEICNNTFYANNGTGTFLKGKNHVEEL